MLGQKKLIHLLTLPFSSCWIYLDKATFQKKVVFGCFLTNLLLQCSAEGWPTYKAPTIVSKRWVQNFETNIRSKHPSKKKFLKLMDTIES